MSEAGRSRTRGAPMYGVVSLVLAGSAAVAVKDSPERVWGIAIAWGLQLAAVWPLDKALAAGRDATRPWLRGIALRVGGLIVTGTLAFAGAATTALPASYGISMVILLLTEAAWLARIRRDADATRGKTGRA